MLRCLIFPPRPQFRLYNRKGNVGHKWFTAPNPPNGAMIDYYLKTKPEGNVRITISDTSGKVVRELTGTKEAGVNRVVWDLRMGAPGQALGGGRGGGGRGVAAVALGAPQVSKLVNSPRRLNQEPRRARLLNNLAAAVAVASAEALADRESLPVNTPSKFRPQARKRPRPCAFRKTRAFRCRMRIARSGMMR